MHIALPLHRLFGLLLLALPHLHANPLLLGPPPADGGAPLFRARGLRHPAGVAGRDGTFVPNDIQLGGADAPPFIVLTGARAGGPGPTGCHGRRC